MSRFCTASILLLIITGTLRPQSSVHFAVVGDYGLAGQAELGVSNLAKSWSPEFVITLGDNNYEFGEASTIDQNIGQYYHEFIYPYTGSYGAGAIVNRFFPAMGNHEWIAAGALPYLNYFTLPGNERYFDFVRGPVHFFVIDSDVHEPDGNTSSSAQGTWLMNALSASISPWNLIYFHHPPYTSGTRHGSNTIMRWPFRQWGATAVLSGHEHLYERLIEDSLVYFVNGLGGKSIYEVGPPIPGSIVRYNSNYGAQRVDADADSIVFTFINLTGTVIDSYTIRATHTLPAVTVHAGWNLISLPTKPIDGRDTVLFPSARSKAFTYVTDGYHEADTLRFGVGYWMKFDSFQSVSVAGDSIIADTISIQPGWNMIGALSVPIAASTIIQQPPGIVTSLYYEFNGSYLSSDSLLPGRGYWVKASAAGELILSSSGSPAR